MIGKRLKELRVSKKLTQSQLAKKIGVADSTISMYERDEREPDMETLEAIADEFNVDMNYLYGFANDKGRLFEGIINTHISEIPLYSEISCGKGIFIDDNIDEYIALPESLLHGGKEYFCQFAVGDSMIDENIVPGDLLVFEKTQHIENGQIGVFCIDDNVATCKKFYHDEVSNIITLQPANSKYAPIIVTIESMSFHVVGKLSLVINKRD